jgi:hypothetical protein
MIKGFDLQKDDQHHHNHVQKEYGEHKNSDLIFLGVLSPNIKGAQYEVHSEV